MASYVFAGMPRNLLKIIFVLFLSIGLAGCSGFNLFGKSKIVEEEIIPPETLYTSALSKMDERRFKGALEDLQKLERQHPYSEYSEKSKLMTTFINFQRGDYSDAVLSADRYLALYPSSGEVPYILYLKGTSYYAQIKDITRDQQLATDAIDTLQLLVNNYPNSKYVDDAQESIRVSFDQLAGKEMSVGRYYQGNGQQTAAINRFRMVIENFETSTHVEEALYRLTESYLTLGLVGEAKTAAAVLGHNFAASKWYELSYNLLQEQGLSPEVVDGNWIAQSVNT